MTPNEHIEWFKRFAAAYLRWANFNFDRIVRDAVNRERTLSDVGTLDVNRSDE